MATPPSELVVRLGSGPAGRKAYRDYAAAFSNGEFEKFSRFYTDDVICELSSLTLNGKDAIVNFYKEMFPKVRERLIVHQLVVDDNAIAIDVTSEFTGLVDARDFKPMPLGKGEVLSVRLFVFYTLRGGKIAHIRAARFGTPQAGPAKP